jgi:hypothetical protein
VIAHLPCDMVEQDAFAELFEELLKLNQLPNCRLHRPCLQSRKVIIHRVPAPRPPAPAGRGTVW